MPFVGSYSKAMSILSEIGNGKCKDKCKCKNESIKRKCGECNNINCKCIKYQY